MISDSTEELLDRILAAHGLFLFLDYDGTLAEFAPTPDHILPNSRVIELISRLADKDNIQIVILSGRRLKHIQALLPVDGILLAGTYGLEMLHPQEGEFQQFGLSTVRPTLEAIRRAGLNYWK
jgi:trehalose 6-phosphate phosphatase